MSISVLNNTTSVKVSSVLNRDVKQFGKKYMFDGDEETCWNSDQGSPQWVAIEFSNHVEVSEIQLKFQGGFVGKECFLEGFTDMTKEPVKLLEFYPEDVNSLQIFELEKKSTVQKLRVVFSNSSDFFGRITLYSLDILGNKIS